MRRRDRANVHGLESVTHVLGMNSSMCPERTRNLWCAPAGFEHARAARCGVNWKLWGQNHSTDVRS